MSKDKPSRIVEVDGEWLILHWNDSPSARGAVADALARIMHKFSTAPTKSSGVRCAPPALHSVGLLNVPYSTFAGASVARGATHSGRRFRRFVTRTYA